MGNIFQAIFGRRKRILIQGLQCAGKTVLLYRLKLGEVVASTPFPGFQVESVTYKTVEFSTWDTNSELDTVPEEFYEEQYKDTVGVIYVVDSNDKDRLDRAKQQLYILMKHELLKDAAFLILANKQDLPCAMSPEDLAEVFQLDSMKQKTNVFGTNDGNGAYEALDWLSEEIKQQK